MKIDFLSRTIVVSAKTMKKASNFRTREYEELRQIMRELPDFTIRAKHSHTTLNRNRGMTYEYMERYIASCAPERMDEFILIRTNIGFPATSKWFREIFPEHRNEVDLCTTLEKAV